MSARPDESVDLGAERARRARVIRIGPDLDRAVDAAVDALRGEPALYQRDGQLVRITHTADDEADAAALVGAPQIRPVAPATMRETLTRVARFERRDGRDGDWRPTVPTDAVTHAVLARGEWPTVRPILAVTECPTMRPDGSIIDRPGYDAATAYVYEPHESMRGVRVPARPTRADAQRALAELVEPWAEMPWRSEADRSVALAAVLTLLARPAIRGAVPGFVIDAATPGSGKSLSTHVVAMIATGRPAAMAHWPVDEDELSKVFGAYAVRGASFVTLDNIATPFGGAPLDRCLTAVDTVELRILGRTEVPTLRWRAVIMATGNGMEIIGDTTRRVLVGRMEPAEERPEERTGYRHPNLLAWVSSERARLVQAALTVLRAYVVAERPEVGVRPWGGFEAWTFVAAAIVYAGGADPTACRIGAGDDGARAALGALLGMWQRWAGTEGRTARETVERLYTAERLRGQAAPDGWDDLREAIEALAPTKPGTTPSPRTLGERLRRAKGRVVGGRRLAIAGENRNGMKLWAVETVESPCGVNGVMRGHSQPVAATIDRAPLGLETDPADPADPAVETQKGGENCKGPCLALISGTPSEPPDTGRISAAIQGCGGGNSEPLAPLVDEPEERAAIREEPSLHSSPPPPRQDADVWPRQGDGDRPAPVPHSPIAAPVLREGMEVRTRVDFGELPSGTVGRIVGLGGDDRLQVVAPAGCGYYAAGQVEPLPATGGAS